MTCEKHKKYKALRKPTSNCGPCEDMWDCSREQSAFEKMVVHCMNQRERCVGSNGSCRHVSVDGLNKCAVGSLLPIKLGKKLDVLGTFSVFAVADLPECQSYLGGLNIRMLVACQNAHDFTRNRNRESRRRMLKEFKEIAVEYDLKMPKKAWRDV